MSLISKLARVLANHRREANTQFADAGTFDHHRPKTAFEEIGS
jgi:hypothetical protein